MAWDGEAAQFFFVVHVVSRLRRTDVSHFVLLSYLYTDGFGCVWDRMGWGGMDWKKKWAMGVWREEGDHIRCVWWL